MTFYRNVEVDLCVCDFSQKGLRKMAAIHSHASGREVRVDMVVWPNPVMIASIDLDDLVVNFDHKCGEER